MAEAPNPPEEAKAIVVCVEMITPDKAMDMADEFMGDEDQEDFEEAEEAAADPDVQWYEAYAFPLDTLSTSEPEAVSGRLFLVYTWDKNEAGEPEYGFEYFDTGTEEEVDRKDFKLLIGYLSETGEPLPEKERIPVGPKGYEEAVPA